MKRKILIIFALIVTVSVIFCGMTVSAEEAGEEAPAIGGGSWFAENWKSVAEAVLGSGGVAFAVALLAFIGRIIDLRKTLRKTDVNNSDIKGAVNDMIDELGEMRKAVEAMKEDTTRSISVLSDKEAGVAERNEAVCKVIAALINASNLPDATKEYLVGDMNKVLGYTREADINECES